MNLMPTSEQLKRIQERRSFHKNWYLKLNDPENNRALWIRFSILCSNNGFKKVAETSAIFFERGTHHEVKKLALKQTYDMDSFRADEAAGIQIGPCVISDTFTRGRIQSKGQTIEWDLSYLPGRHSSFQIVPDLFSKLGLTTQPEVSESQEIFFSGTTKILEETQTWKNAPGMQGHFHSPKNSHSWVWAHCNTFTNERNEIVPFLFEGLTIRSWIGPIATPRISSFFISYQEQDYYFNTLRDALHIKSKNSFNDWEFQADRNDLSFRGVVKSDHKDLCGITAEDTQGSLLYSSASALADLEICIYRKGKLEMTLDSNGTAAFEVTSREKNPYVPSLI